MLKNLFGDLATDLTLKTLMRLLSRTTYSTGGSLRVVLAEAGLATQAVNGTVTIQTNTGNSMSHQMSHDNFVNGFRSRISKT